MTVALVGVSSSSGKRASVARRRMKWLVRCISRPSITLTSPWIWHLR